MVLPFWCLLTRVVPDKFQKSSKMVVCVCDCVVFCKNVILLKLLSVLIFTVEQVMLFVHKFAKGILSEIEEY